MKKIGFLLFFLAGSAAALRAQQLTPDSVLSVLAARYPQEKVYLHFDKEKYLAGDTMWFKSYLYSGVFPGDISTGIYIELWNPQGKLVDKKYFPVIESSSAGQMELKDTLPEGAYTVRAYTAWMMNSDADFFFQRRFTIYNPSHHVPTVVTLKRGIDVQFFPEGGDAVAGLLTRVAFKAVDGAGMPYAAKGKVVDEAGKEVATFASQHDGMGVFDFTPEKGHRYKAVVVTTGGGSKVVALPVVLADGVILNAKSTSGGVLFTLRTDSASAYIDQHLEVVANMYQHMVFKAKTSLTKDVSEINGFIPTKQMETGMLQITLFDGQGKPLAERMVFIYPKEVRIDAELKTDSISTAKKGENSWTLNIKDSLKGNFSVAVTDADILTPPDDRSNILSSLLMEGDIRGHVYNPAWYFQNSSDSTLGGLDLVMLTHGWRRFDWTAYQNNTFPAIKYPAETNYLRFSGLVYNEVGRRLLRNTQVNLILTGNDSSKQFMILPVDSAGRFEIKDMVFFNTVQGYYQANKKGNAGKNISLELDRLPQPRFFIDSSYLFTNSELQGDADYISAAQREQLAFRLRSKKAQQLSEIVIQGRRKDPKQELEERYTNGLFKGGEGYTYDLMNDPSALGAMSIFQYLQGRVPGLQISGSPTSPTLSYRGGGAPTIFLDEMQTDVDMIQSVSMTDIALVKVFRPPFVGAMGGGANGAIAIYTKKGGDMKNTSTGLNKITLAGYNPVRQYYTPRYDMDYQLRQQPDYRTTLIWIPYMVSYGGKVTSKIRFCNNDSATRYRVIIEGMDEVGNLLHFEQVVE